MNREDFRSLSATALAHIFDVRPNQIAQWKQGGCPCDTTTRYPKYDSAHVINWRIKNAKKRTTLPTGNKNVDSDMSGEDGVALEALERYRIAKATAAEFDLDIKKKKFIERDRHDEIIYNAGEMVRQAFQAIPKKLAVRLSKMKDSSEVEKCLDDEMVDILRQLAADASID